MSDNALEEILERINKLNEIGIALSGEQNTGGLLERILVGAKELTHADGGTVYTVTEEQQLKFEIIMTDSLGLAMGGTTGQDIPFAPIPLYLIEDGQPNTSMVVTSAVLRDETINIPDAYYTEGFDFTGTRKFDRKTGYRTQSILTIPMKNHESDIIGVLQLINSTQEDGEVVAFSKKDQQLAESLASQAAMTLTNKRLIDDLNNLFEAFIRLIATAIDEKSPYTGSHCKRVPELTMMLAEAAARSDAGDLRDFSLSDADRYELEIAAWLHDCGKITTPEYVMDKATKLETIFDRIQLVDTRFELLKREAEIRVLKQQLESQGNGKDPQAELDAELKLLDEEREFLRKCNVGGEFMSPDDQERVRQIGTRTYTGVNGKTTRLLTNEEIHNLNIEKGTLTAEEREVINNHIVATIKMLESLPFPKHLRKVPEFAGGHHERMDGKGYPKGLKRDEMSVPARVMAIADIFEALTARDRPYKQGKRLTECLRIMGFMKEESHIDPDLFEVFIRDGIYMKYAERFLHPEQIDEVKLEEIPGFSLN